MTSPTIRRALSVIGRPQRRVIGAKGFAYLLLADNFDLWPEQHGRGL